MQHRTKNLWKYNASGPWKWRHFIMRNLSAYKHIINLTERRTLAELSCAIKTIIRKHLMKTRATATHTHICAWQEVPSNKVFWWSASISLKTLVYVCIVKPPCFVYTIVFIPRSSSIIQSWQFACHLNIIYLWKVLKFFRDMITYKGSLFSLFWTLKKTFSVFLLLFL